MPPPRRHGPTQIPGQRELGVGLPRPYGHGTRRMPGGEEQRRDAFHVGINVILYAMTENYKEDLIHVPFIRRRLTR